MAKDGEVIQRQHFCYHVDTICHPKSGYLDATIMRCFQTELFSRFLPSSYASRVNLVRAKPSRLMQNCKYGSPVEIIIFHVQYFFSA